jgi:prevent-host-death family protein
MHEAKTHPSRLVEAAARGEPVVIARAGKPLVKVVALEDVWPSPFGFLEGQFTYDPEVDRELQEMFERSAIDSRLDRGGPEEPASESSPRPTRATRSTASSSPRPVSRA